MNAVAHYPSLALVAPPVIGDAAEIFYKESVSLDCSPLFPGLFTGDAGTSWYALTTGDADLPA